MTSPVVPFCTPTLRFSGRRAAIFESLSRQSAAAHQVEGRREIQRLRSGVMVMADTSKSRSPWATG
jgi:hypothetical protein